MWGQVMKMKNRFMGQVFWNVTNGKTVNALSQPWYENWDVREEATRSDRLRRVCDLVDERTTQWNVQELERLFQPSQIQQIVAGDNKPDPNDIQRDRLVWKQTKDGKYSVKEGYKLITNTHDGLTMTHMSMWPSMSKWKNVAPRIKIFLWRLLNRGLPMAVNMHVRLPNFSPRCQRCHEEDEYEMHCLFFCQTSRQVWFGSTIGLRVHDLPMSIEATVQQILRNLDGDGLKVFANTLWKIWKERNKAVIEHCIFKPQEVLKKINASLRPELCASRTTMVGSHGEIIDKYEVCRDGWQVIMDASWSNAGEAGVAYIVYEKGILHSIGLHTLNSQDVFLAEAMVLMEAIKHVYEHIAIATDTRVQFFSDCSNLVDAVNQWESVDIPSWRTTGVLNQIITKLYGKNHNATLHHAKREAIHRAHILANIARRRNMNYRGQPVMELQHQGCMDVSMDEIFFQRVQEAPP
ncbi:Ribonuclease H-like superfamily protein [Rhynchospora pubera]|uniref:Ribonuclease H-like superfamily protein n=1 Tax=Rhynchospora pubera TaxID=906938 RepID=A0AAV8FZG9_9POAL|nr:Ribonuclease H-like superfamily protein [Rhynchospora pubera]